ncbi:MAG: dephospho-CoA kinase [Asticcacaulis sp.]
MIRLGLTGSIGMGKSTIAAMFADEGVPVWDADLAVHRLYSESEPLKAELVAAFGDVLSDNAVDRSKLTNVLKTLPDGFARLNAIVHPATIMDRQAFLARYADAPLVVADIPLLFETGAEKDLDKVLVVSAPADVQAARVLARAGMTPEKFNTILSQQMPDADKREKADFVIDTSRSLDDCRDAVRDLIKLLA